MKYFLLCSFLSFGFLSIAQNNLLTKFEQSKGTETATYTEGIAYFEWLDKTFPEIQVRPFGSTDIGKPIHVAVLSIDKDFEVKSLRKKNKVVLFINNAIHAGEPDGVDATMMLFRDIAQDLRKQNTSWKSILENVVIVAIPFYNVDGVLNRSKNTRVNQNGPSETGFRGNAKNLDLNRDFIKCDSKNARTFVEFYQIWQPDVYIENHVTNGADYQHVITYLATQYQKLGGELGNYLQKELIPDLATQMKEAAFEMCPYVNIFGETPDKGYAGFLDSPRYSSGYAALFHSLAFIVETHMLKPFKQRVEGTYQFMKSMLLHLQKHGKKIQTLRQKHIQQTMSRTDFVLEWQQDKNKFDEIEFKGFEASYLESKVTNGKRLFYDRTKPYTRKVPFYNFYSTKTTVQKPFAYIIPQAWTKVIELLKLNGVKLKQLQVDTQVPVSAYYIQQYETVRNPYEGHYLHYNTQTKTFSQTLQFYAGDYVVETNQLANRFIIETLEPAATDSYFNWNFFDSILQQKEWFSDYVFEEIAEKILLENPTLKQQLEEKKSQDEEFAKNPSRQLAFIYQNSPYYEESHLRYPIFRLENDISLNLK